MYVEHDRFYTAIIILLYLFIYLHVPFCVVHPGVMVEFITDGVLYIIV